MTAALRPTVAPAPQQNQADAVGVVSRKSLAQRILRFHTAGLRARRVRDLLSQKYLLHIDGEGDTQYADILEGQRVEIPRTVSEYRKTENLLRPIIDNAVAHHTTMPLHYSSKTRPDREARERGLVDGMLANHLVDVQDLNGLFAEALYCAMPAGLCQVHAYWRDNAVDQYEPAVPGQATPGMIDCWLGNPWDTIFDRAAKRGSIHRATYGRVLPADAVRRMFAHIPETRNLQGTTRLPSSSVFQRIARSWRLSGLGLHGHPVMEARQGYETDEELLIVVCQEILPGLDPEFPEGRLSIIAVPDASDLSGRDNGAGHAVLLADQPLPGGDFSFTNFYSHHRSDDVLGKPWVADLDQLQVDLNILLSKRWEAEVRMVNAPIVGPAGVLAEDMMQVGDGYDYLEVEPSAAGWRPTVMQWPSEVLAALSLEVREKRQALYTIGGYQASSRGEAPGSRIAAKAVELLQAADRSIHGPVNARFKRAATDFAQKCWKQFKAFGTVPWLLGITGDEYGYLAEPYVDNTRVSERPPNYQLVNLFGTTLEQRGQEVLDLMARRGADGQPFLSTEAARRAYPDPMLFGDEMNPRAVARRRAKTVATQLLTLARRFREQTGFQGTDTADPQVQQAAQWVFGVLEQRFRRMRSDDLKAHIESLQEIEQDETADSIARWAASLRLEPYYQWQAEMAAQQAPAQAAAGQQPKQVTAGAQQSAA